MPSLPQLLFYWLHVLGPFFLKSGGSMKALIDRFFSGELPRFLQALDDFDRHIDPAAKPESQAIVEELTRCINASLAACSEFEKKFRGDSSQLKKVQDRYREAIRPWFDKSWFMRRALSKPRGYPGDYELLTAIYDGLPKSSGLGGYLDRYFLNTTLGRAVPARMRAVRSFLLDEIARREGNIAILNVACGSCREYVEGFAVGAGQEVQITCLDNDNQALDYVRANVAPLIADSVQTNLIRYNALRMTSAPVNRERFGRSDIIYSVGLCDYIPDNYLIPMLKGWRESLQEDGIVYVAFKDMKRYDKAEYQWLVDWYFYQRTESECRHLFEAAEYDMDSLEVTRDETGVILNFVGRNKVDALVRVDEAERLPLPLHGDVVAAPRGDRVVKRS